MDKTKLKQTNQNIHRQGIAHIFAIVVLAVIVLTTTIFYTRTQLAKVPLGGNLASIYGYEGKGIPFTPPEINTGVDRSNENATCGFSGMIKSRVDPVTQPLVYETIYINKIGYCGLYSILLSAYHTFGIKKILIGGYALPIKSGGLFSGDVNLDLVEAFLREHPEYTHGTSIMHQRGEYESLGKTCSESMHLSGESVEDLKKQCEDLKKNLKDKFDCNLQLYGKTSHIVNVKSAHWDEKTKSCKFDVYDTSGQFDPDISPDTHSIEMSFYRRGYHPAINYPKAPNKAEYTMGGTVMCCK